MNPIRKIYVGVGLAYPKDGGPTRAVGLRRWGFVCPRCGHTETCRTGFVQNRASRKVAKDLLHYHMKEAHAALW